MDSSDRLREVESQVLEGQAHLAARARGAEDGQHHVLLAEVLDALLVEDLARDDQYRRVDADAALERPEQLPLVGLRAEVDLGVRGELRPGERGLDGLAAGAAVREQDLRANRSSAGRVHRHDNLI